MRVVEAMYRLNRTGHLSTHSVQFVPIGRGHRRVPTRLKNELRVRVEINLRPDVAVAEAVVRQCLHFGFAHRPWPDIDVTARVVAGALTTVPIARPVAIQVHAVA